MSAGKLNILVEQGATFSRILEVKDGAGDPYDLSTIVEVRSSIKTRPQDSTANAAFDFTIQSPPADGRISWTMPASTTATLTPGEQKYDVLLEASDGTITRLIEGTATVAASIT